MYTWSKKKTFMNNNIIVHNAGLKDIPAIVSIYREAFPEKTSSQLGQRTCEGYFSSMMNFGAYRLIAASFESEIVGFSIIQTDRNRSINNNVSWMLSSPMEIILYVFRHPLYLFQRLLKVLKAITKSNKSKTNIYSILGDFNNSAYLALIAVSKNARGLGIGKLLLERSIDVSRETGKTYLDLDVLRDNINAQKMYENSGLKESLTMNPEMFMFIA